MEKLLNKYHLPHNAVRIDEFNYMLNCVDLEKEYYTYKELKICFLINQIRDNKLELFHPAYHKNLSTHENINVRNIYKACVDNPTVNNICRLMEVQYTPKKTFNQLFNETVRDYTEFFAFLGLLPTYYKGKSGGENRHYVSDRLKKYINNEISFDDIILDFKYRNSSKNFDTLDMYRVNLRPFVVALKALNYYFEKGFNKISHKIISAIVVYSKDENIEELCKLFHDPTLDIKKYYKHVFDCKNDKEYKSVFDELGRATLFLKPYLIEMGYVDKKYKGFYNKGKRDIDFTIFSDKVAFCNSHIGKMTLTPVVGKIINILNEYSKLGVSKIDNKLLFDKNVKDEDKPFLLEELEELNCIKVLNNEIYVNKIYDQISLNPYTDFFDISDADYVAGVSMYEYDTKDVWSKKYNSDLMNELDDLKQYAYGSNGPLYEEKIYNIIKKYIKQFDVKWLGTAATGKRLSDIFIKAQVIDNSSGKIEKKNIAIIIECKAGNAIKAFDERKEIDDIINTLASENGKIDGVWYWVVDSNSLPTVDEHGGYRSNQFSKSFAEKLNEIQFAISEYMRVPTIITAFSYDAIKNYITYLYDKTDDIGDNMPLSKVNVPHFWRWSKTFMNLQYVMVYQDLRLGV